jgi:serine/threonine protein kinase/tetratricopeptide (TPR) repeat protein
MNAEEILAAAVEKKTPGERAAYLDGACAGRPELRALVDGLLKAHEDAGSFLNQPLFEPLPTLDQPAHAEKPGAVIGPYKLLEQIGEGGFGVVYMAEQTEPVRRKVALKILKPGMDTRQVVARFEAERQALAIMDHPNIAKVHDGGATPSGRPYFVMELVKGVPITEFCDQNHLTPRQRLELFIPVCQAVQHAHQKGIIHRDLKPSNVLVSRHDTAPVVKVIDFGVAKALGQELTDKTLFTGVAQMVGTPLYMSPEQAGMSDLDIDTRSDIYSLGVLLYELLTGTTPFEKERFKQAAYDEIRRIIREEEPPKPSTRLSDSKDSLPSISAQRQTEPAKLTKLVRGELDWIVMKALEKDRNRRYETANGFAMDIQRYLADEPVQAGPPSATYRLRKFIHRNRGPVLAATLVLLALLSGIIGTTIGLVRAQRSQEEAEQEAWKAGQERDQANAAREAEQKAKEEERKAKNAEIVQRSLAEAARDRAAATLDAMTSSVVGDAMAQQAFITPEQKQFLTMALEYYREVLKEKASDEAAQKRLADAAWRVGLIETRLGRPEQAALVYRKAGDLYGQLAKEFPLVAEYRNRLAASRINLGVELAQLGKQIQAEREHRAAKSLFEKLVKESPGVRAYRQGLAGSQVNLADVLADMGKREQAEKELRAALDVEKQLVIDFPQVSECQKGLASSHIHLGVLLLSMKKRKQAEQEYGAANNIFKKLVSEQPAAREYQYDLALSHNNLANALATLDQLDQAEANYRAALDIKKRLVGDFPSVPLYRHRLAIAHYNLAGLLGRLDKLDLAEQELRAAVDMEKQLTAEFPDVPAYRASLAQAHRELGLTLNVMGKHEEGTAECRAAVAMAKELAAEFPALPAYRASRATHHSDLGAVLSDSMKWDQAETEYRVARDIAEKLTAEFPEMPAYRQRLAGIRHDLANVLAKLGKPDLAQAEYWAAIDLYKKLAAEFPTIRDYREYLASSHGKFGDLLVDLRQPDQAQAEYRSAIDLYKKLVGESPAVQEYALYLGGNLCNLGNVLRNDKRPADALAWFDRAIATLSPVVQQKPKFVQAWRFLRNSHVGRGRTFANSRKPDQAQQDFRAAIDIFKKLTAEYPTVPEYCDGLGDSHNELGRLLEQLRKWDQAETEYRAALELRKKLAADFPAVTNYTTALGGGLCNLGNLFRLSGRSQDALGWYDQAIGTLSGVAEKEPKQVTVRQYLLNSHAGRAMAFDALKRHAEAVTDWTRALELVAPAQKPPHSIALMYSRARAGQIDAALGDAEQIARTNPMHMAVYDCASVYALAYAKSKDEKHAVRAMELLRQAVANGFRDAAFLKKDADFDSLRARDNFRELVTELEKKSNGPKQSGR